MATSCGGCRSTPSCRHRAPSPSARQGPSVRRELPHPRDGRSPGPGPGKRVERVSAHAREPGMRPANDRREHRARSELQDNLRGCHDWRRRGRLNRPGKSPGTPGRRPCTFLAPHPALSPENREVRGEVSAPANDRGQSVLSGAGGLGMKAGCCCSMRCITSAMPRSSWASRSDAGSLSTSISGVTPSPSMIHPLPG